MPRRTSETSSPKYSRTVPSREAQPLTNTLPSVYNCPGFIGLCDLLMRRRVYMGIWAGSAGNIVFLDIKDGGTFRRFGNTDQAQLNGCVAALYAEYDDGESV